MSFGHLVRSCAPHSEGEITPVGIIIEVRGNGNQTHYTQDRSKLPYTFYRYNRRAKSTENRAAGGTPPRFQPNPRLRSDLDRPGVRRVRP